MADFPINYYFIFFVIGAIGFVLFAEQWLDKRLKKQAENPFERLAANGTRVVAPPNVDGYVVSVEKYLPNPKKTLIKVIDKNTGEESRHVVNPTLNVKMYNPLNAMLDKDEMIIVLNCDEKGSVYENFYGLDFTSSDMQHKIDRMDTQIEKLQSTAERLASKKEAQNYLEMNRMFGDAQTFSHKNPPATTGAPTTQVNIIKEEDEEHGGGG